MILLPAFAALNAPETSGTMKPILIKHADGSGETAYVQDPGQAESKKCTPTQKLHKNLIVVYLLVGTISLALSAYATIRLLHKK